MQIRRKQLLRLFLSFLISSRAYSNLPDLDLLSEPLIGTPYRSDGAINAEGDFTTFANQRLRFANPGLNCSGFVLELSRRYLGIRINISEAIEDIDHNSGPDSEHGQDWDFGKDLIRNISRYGEYEILTHSKTLPNSAILYDHNRGFQLHKEANWEYILDKMKPGWMYLLSINKPLLKKGYDVLHYHVGVLQKKEASKKVFYFHTTRLGKTHKIEMSHADGMGLFHRQFAKSKYSDKYVYIIGVRPRLRYGRMRTERSGDKHVSEKFFEVK